MHAIKKIVLAAGVLAAGLGSIAVCARAEGVESNLQVLDRITTQAVDELLANAPAEIRTRKILLAPDMRDERYDFISTVFVKELTSKGYRVVTASPQSSPDSSVSQKGVIRFEFQALDFDLRYVKIYRAYLIGGKRVKRHAKVTILGQLTDMSDQSVLWVGQASKTSDDQFPASMFPDVESGTLAFTKPPHSSTSWGKIVEPVVVSGIVVGLIYLFFSNQNNN
jgi:hypothetical protein